jgi:hypothetical protein
VRVGERCGRAVHACDAVERVRNASNVSGSVRYTSADASYAIGIVPYGREIDLRAREGVVYAWNSDVYADNNERYCRHHDVRTRNMAV